MRILVAGAGGFIGGHLVSVLKNLNYKIVAVDIKPLSNWLQLHSGVKNLS